TALVRKKEEPTAVAAENNRHGLKLCPQYRADRQVNFGGFDLGAVAEAQARAFDKAALRVYTDAFGAGRDDLAQFLAAHRAKGRRHDLLRVKEIELLLAGLGFERRPGARRGIAATDQIVDEIDMVGPVDPRLGLAHPALIGGLALILRPFGGAARRDEIGRLQQGLDAEREDLVEIE